jgi:hypothetical protein
MWGWLFGCQVQRQQLTSFPSILFLYSLTTRQRWRGDFLSPVHGIGGLFHGATIMWANNAIKGNMAVFFYRLRISTNFNMAAAVCQHYSCFIF